jgi:uncharacterized protein with FMN-binding domain
MPKRPVAYFVMTVLALALLFSFKTPANGAAAAGLPGQAAVAPAVPAGSAGPVAVAASGAPASAGSGTFTGAVVQDPFGSVQVQITLAGGKITNVTALKLPSGGRSGDISQTVAPILQGEVLTAQSATIDSVSGATYTSEAYTQSLQSALDQAHA